MPLLRPSLIIVTGSNRGIGKAVCQQILKRPDIGPLKLFATSRSGEDLGLESTKERQTVYRRLDVSKRESIDALRDEVKADKDGGGVRLLVNNAGINLDNEKGMGRLEAARKTIGVNFEGTLDMCCTFLPHLSKDTGRIVNLSSVASSLKPYSEEIQRRFRSALFLSDVETLAEEYLHAVETSTEQSSGFSIPPRHYAMSKALVRAMTRVLSGEHHAAHPESKILINSCCPGWINTDMGGLVGSGRTMPPKTAEEGAGIVMRLGFDELEDEDRWGVSGEYWANESVRSRGLGSVQRW